MEDEILIAHKATPSAAPLTISTQNSPILSQKQFFPKKSSLKMLQKVSSTEASPQQSPMITQLPPVVF